MRAFTFTTVPDIHCALGAIERLPELVQRFNAQRVLIVTDQGILTAGLLAPCSSTSRRGWAFGKCVCWSGCGPA